MAYSIQYVCWEYNGDDGGCSPYPPEKSFEIEQEYGRNPKGKVAFNDHIINLANNRQESLEGAAHLRCNYQGDKNVWRRHVVMPHSPNITAYWMWCMQKNTSVFTPYAVEASVDIEHAYTHKMGGGSAIVNLESCPCKLPYTINFNEMNQTRHVFLTKREIMRVELKPGTSLQFYLKAQDNPNLKVHPPLNNHATLPFGMSGGGPVLDSGGGPVLGSAGAAVGSGAMLGDGAAALGSQYPSTSNYCVQCHTPYVCHVLSCSSCNGHVCSTAHMSASVISGGSSGGSPQALPNLYYGTTGGGSSSCHPVTTSGAGYSSSGATPMGGYSTTEVDPLMTVAPGSLLHHEPSSSHSYRQEQPSTNKRSKLKNQQKSVSGAIAATPAVPKSTSKKGLGRPRKKAEGSRPPSFDVEVGGRGDSQFLLAHARRVKRLKAKDDEPCPICLSKLSEPSGFDDSDPLPDTQPLNIYKLRKCGHRLHYLCLRMYLENTAKGKSGFQCPTCKKLYGVITGDMPEGRMEVRKTRTALPGHSGCGTIEIVYNFSPGIHNDCQYRSNGFPRICYLPDSPKGQKVLKLLKVAWERRLTFTIGTSVTTGATDTVVWNEIHHKTDPNFNHSGHGYPDPEYMDRVLFELAAQGVQEEKLEEKQEEKLEEPNESETDDEDEDEGNDLKLS